MTHGVAHPLAHASGQVLAVQANDAGIMDHLDQNHYVIGCLHNRLEVVVGAGQDRWTAGRADPQETTLAQGTPLGVVVGSRALGVQPPGSTGVRSKERKHLD